MVILSLTPSRTADVLRRAADDLQVRGWDPDYVPVLFAIDRAADYCRPGEPQEDVMLAAWEALAAHVGVDEPHTGWEAVPGRTAAEVLAVLRACADGLVTS